MLCKYLRYDNFVLISKTARLQEQFEVICDLTEILHSKFKIYENVLNFQLKDVAKTKKTIIVVDDYQEESDTEQLYINKLFIKSRHYKCSTIYLAQSYFKISQWSRSSANYFIFFRIHSTKEINRIHKEIAGELTQEQFHDLFITATDADGECWSYLMVDTNAKTIHEKFRKNMRCVYIQWLLSIAHRTKKKGDLFFGINIQGLLFFKLVEYLREQFITLCGVQVEFFEHRSGCYLFHLCCLRFFDVKILVHLYYMRIF